MQAENEMKRSRRGEEEKEEEDGLGRNQEKRRRRHLEEEEEEMRETPKEGNPLFRFFRGQRDGTILDAFLKQNLHKIK